MNKHDHFLELHMILESSNPSSVLKKLYDDGILHDILPEVCDLYSEEKGHKNNFVHTLQVLDNACQVSDSVWFRLAALLHDIGKAKTKRLIDGEWTFHGHEAVGASMLPYIWQRFGFISPDTPGTNIVDSITRFHGRAKELCYNASDSAIRRFMKETDHFEIIISFCKCDITTKNVDKKKRIIHDLDALWKRAHEIREADKLAEYRIPLDGNWLMKETGRPAGRWIKDVKEAVEREIKEGRIPDEENAAKEFARSLLKLNAF